MTEQSQVIAAPPGTLRAVEELVEKFQRNLDAYHNPQYKEDQCRIEFINPFFDALGWDISNRQAAAEQYKDVVYEDSLAASGSTKAPDYSFRIGGVRKFFLEAKKPAINLKTDPGPALQLRSYAWSAKLPLSVLTDFEEFAVYDCRIKPDQKDRADTARVQYLGFEQYLSELNWIYSRFSKEAIIKGSFDKFAEAAKGLGPKVAVDVAFLKEIESWREALARNIALRNPKLDIRPLNDAVQRTIDRIVFLRIAEDRGIERYQQLLAITNGANIYKRLVELFYKSEDKYNSGLFDFKKDTFTTALKIDDKILKEIIGDLYFPKSPYRFSVIGAEILGNIYEQFLGKVIRLTAGHQAKVEEKPEVKKAGGVYYTPNYIVDYIVKNTVGKLIYYCGRDTPVPSGRDTPVPDKPIKTVSNKLLIRQHNLPHWQIGGSIYFVSFRSARGVLPEPAMKQVMANIKFDDGKKYDLFLAVVMPDHVHMLIQPREIKPGAWFDLGEIMKGIKGVSAREINKMLGATGQVWQDENYDHIVRNEQEFEQKLQYILQNPVKAGLVKETEEYNFFVRDRSVPATPKEISKLKILDPACGSGSFLLGAYQYLLDYHLKWYLSARDTPVGHKPIYQGPHGQWFLTTKEKKRILLNNIFGVDIDPQAVEVTKLSLLLKVLENENEETLKKQLKLFRERALPDLDNNIKCGNSLIGTDFYSNQQGNLFDDEQKYKINAFDWENEFKDIFSCRSADKSVSSTTDTLVGKQKRSSSGADTPVGDNKENQGFDVVIGNPPYVRQGSLEKYFMDYAKTRYQTFTGMADLYVYFIEKAHKLLKKGGCFGMICSNKFMRANYGSALRNFLANEVKLEKIVDFGELPVFQNAATFPAIILTENTKTKDQKFIYAPIKRLSFQSLDDEVSEIGNDLDARSLKGDNWTLAKKEEINIIEKMKAVGIPLGQYANNKIYRGVLTGLNEAFVIDKATRDKLIKKDKKSSELIKPFVVGDDIRKYKINFQERYLIFCRRGVDIKKYPAVEEHLLAFKERLMPKPKNWKGTDWKGRKPGSYQWHEIQDTVDYFEEFENPKIIYPDIAKESRMTFDPGGLFFGNTAYFIPTDDLYLLGILNSRLIFNFFKRISAVLGDADKKGRLRWFSQDVIKIPIKKIDLSNEVEKSQRDQIVSLVERMLALNKKLFSAKTSDEKTRLAREIDAADREIDKLVYALYGLTEDEIRVIEKS